MNDTAVGAIEQDNAVFAPQFTLTAADGASGRLSGGGLGGGSWRVTNETGSIATAKTTSQYRGPAFAGMRGYVIAVDAELAGPMRALVPLAFVCLDVVRVMKRRRSSS